MNAADDKLPKKRRGVDPIPSIVVTEELDDPQELAVLRDRIHKQEEQIARLRQDNETLGRAAVIFATELANH